MKKIALLIGTVLLSASVLTATAAVQYPTNKFANLWNSHNNVDAIEKHGFAMVYGGKDIRPSALTQQTLTG